MRNLNACHVFITCFALLAQPISPFVSIDESIAQVNNDYGGVGLAAWSVDGMGKLCSLGSAGERTKDSGEPLITTGDSRHHIGSITKSMTASLIAILIEDGTMPDGWETTLGTLLPVANGTEFESATLRQLVAHHAGILDAATPDVYERLPDFDQNDIRDIRRAISEMILLSPPAYPPGTEFLYTNWGYGVAGHIVEVVTGDTWEEALSSRLFLPLGINLGTEFTGPPNNNVDPIGHFGDDQTPCFPSTETPCDAPSWASPSGGFSGPVAAMAKYLSWHLQCHNGAIAQSDSSYSLLSSDSCQEIHQPADPNVSPYGYGFWWFDSEWLGGRFGLHDGHNTLNYYKVVIVTGIDRAFSAYTNGFSRSDDPDFFMVAAAINVTINTTASIGTGTEECDAPIPSSHYVEDQT